MTENQKNNFLIHVTENIRRIAKEKGVSLKSLSEGLDISEQGLQLLLKKGNIKLPVFYDIAQVLKTDISTILGEYGNKSEGESQEVTKMRELLTELLKKDQR